MIGDDEDLATYPQWTHVEQSTPGNYGVGIWTKKDGQTYVIADQDTLGSPGGAQPYLIVRRTLPNEDSVIWHTVSPHLYEVLFAPGEIEMLFMELVL